MSTKSKKRKTLGEGDIKSSSSSIVAPKLKLPKTIQVRFVKESDECMKPIICSFPGGLPEALQNTEHDDDDHNNNTRNNNQMGIRKPPSFVVIQQQQQSDVNTGNIKNKNTEKGIEQTFIVGKDDTCLYSGSVSLPIRTTKTNTSKSSINAAKGQRSRVCVGVFDTTTNRLSIHESFGSGNIFSLNQSVLSYVPDDTNTNNATIESAEGRTLSSAMERYNALYRDFGSSKKNKVIKSQRANQVNVESVVGAGNVMTDQFLRQATAISSRKSVQEQLAVQHGETDTTSAAGVAAVSNEATEQFRKHFLPPYDKDTAQPRLIYNFQDVVGKAVWEHVRRIVDICLKKSSEDGHPIDFLQYDPRPTRLLPKRPEQQENTTTTSTSTTTSPIPKGDYWNESIKFTLEKIKCKYPDLTSKNASSIVKDQLRYCIILNHFMNLNVLLHKRRYPIRGPDETARYWMSTPAVIARRFLDLFTTSVIGTNQQNTDPMYTMSNVNSDCCCIHILLLYLLVDSATMMRSDDMRLVIDDLKVEPTKAIMLLKQAGCTVKKLPSKTKTNPKFQALLLAPLQFPAPARAYGQKKK
jgi:A49-like RNA polymerase I associated factor